MSTLSKLVDDSIFPDIFERREMRRREERRREREEEKRDEKGKRRKEKRKREEKEKREKERKKGQKKKRDIKKKKNLYNNHFSLSQIILSLLCLPNKRKKKRRKKRLSLFPKLNIKSFESFDGKISQSR